MLRALRHSRRGLLIALAVIGAGLGACGSDDGDGAAGTTAATSVTTVAKPARFTVAEVAKLIGLKGTPADGWTSLTGCRVTRVMTTHAEVLRYRTSTDSLVVTNPADDVGVVFEPGEQCREALTANLVLVK